MPTAEIDVSEGTEIKYLQIRYTRRLHATDLEYHVKASSNLIDWTTLDPTGLVTVIPQGENAKTEIVLFRDNVPITETSQRFLRVEVNLLTEE